MRRVLLVVLTLAGLTTSMGFLPQCGASTRTLDDIATVAVHRKARLDAAFTWKERLTWVSYRMRRVRRVRRWAMGSFTPYRAYSFLMLHAPASGAASYDEALGGATRELNGGADDWRLVEKSERWEIGQGR